MRLPRYYSEPIKGFFIWGKRLPNGKLMFRYTYKSKGRTGAKARLRYAAHLRNKKEPRP